jgi:hypothetical protein
MSLPKEMQANAVVSSAMNMKLPDNEARSQMQSESWQATCWNYFDMIPEYRYAVAWVGNNLSKCKLTITKDELPTDQADATDVLNSFFGGPEGHPEMFRQMGIQFTVAGEGWVFGVSDSMADDWFVAAGSEVKYDPSSESYNVGIEKFPDASVIRAWKPHPRHRLKADSPSRACIPVLSEIFRLTQHVAAQVDSRLASAGILLMPNDISLGAPKIENESGTSQTNDVDASDIVRRLMDTASKAIQDRDSAAALVPIVFQVPVDAVDKIKHLTFWTELDKQAIELRKEAIRRLALGLDMPPEVLEGTADMNHWASWQMEEAAIKSHTEPLLAVITRALTDGVLRPYLRSVAMPEEEVMTYAFGADTTALRLRPNRSKEAFELYDRAIIGQQALIRETGFDPSDAMDTSELLTWLKIKIAGGSATPDMVMAAAEELGLHLNVTPGEAGDTTTRNSTGQVEGTTPLLPKKLQPQIGPDGKVIPPNPAANPKQVAGKPGLNDTKKVNQARPTPSLKGHPENVVPTGETATKRDPLTAAATVLVYRALERAGNRLKTKMGGRKMEGVGAAETYRHIKPQADELDSLLASAWEPARLFFGEGTDELTPKIDAYTRDLLLTGKSLETDTLHAALWND